MDDSERRAIVDLIKALEPGMGDEKRSSELDLKYIHENKADILSKLTDAGMSSLAGTVERLSARYAAQQAQQLE